MSCTRKHNDDCKKECDRLNTLPHITSLERHQNNGTCVRQVHNDPHTKIDPKNRREYQYYTGQTQGWVEGDYGALADVEAELFNITRNLSYCASGKYTPNDCHKTNNSCTNSSQHNKQHPETDCSFLTNHQKVYSDTNKPNCNC